MGLITYLYTLVNDGQGHFALKRATMFFHITIATHFLNFKPERPGAVQWVAREWPLFSQCWYPSPEYVEAMKRRFES